MTLSKCIAALCIAASFPVMADVFATADNKSGGKIVLTDKQGGCNQGWKETFSVAGDGHVIGGCWRFYEKEFIQVHYEDGSHRMYDLEGWEMGDKYRAEPKRGQGKPI